MILSDKIIVFDFDGVVCDSTDECMVTSWNAWEKWEKRNNFRYSVNEFPEEEKSIFRSMRPYVKGAGEYYILRRLLKENIPFRGQDTFDSLGKEWLNFLPAFKEVFFECREIFRSKDLYSWIELHPVFSEVIVTMQRLNNENRLFIATLKDGESVKLILQYHGIKIESSQMIDQSQVRTKLEALDLIRESLGCAKSDMIFLDDNYTHLTSPHKADYLVYLTSWGNIVPEFIEAAKENSIPIADMAILRKMLGF